MRYAVINLSTNMVENVIDLGNPSEWTPPTNNIIVQSDVVQIGDSWNGTAIVPQVQVINTPYVPPSPRQWLERLSDATQHAIMTAGMSNAVVMLWLFKASGNPSIDVTASETITGVNVLHGAGIITADEVTALLAP